MTQNILFPLAQELEGPLPSGLEALDANDVNELISSVRSLKEKQKRDLATALEESLNHVPFMIRGAVRKILFP